MAFIIFDLDGTLAKTNEDLADSINHVRMDYGLQPKSLEYITSFLGCGINNLMSQVMCELKTKEEVAQSVQKQIAYYNQCFTNKTKLYPGVDKTLAILARKYSMAVFTNKVMHQAQGVLQNLGVAKYFKCIIGNDGNIPLKPDPKAIQFVADKTGESLENAWIVGDNWTDLQAGINAGIKNCFCTYGFGIPEKCRMDAIISSFDMLIDIIE